MTKRLTRSRDDQMTAGVCAGLSEYIGVDPTIVRLATVALTLLGAGAAIIVYVVAWIIVPLDDGRLSNRGVLPPPLS